MMTKDTYSRIGFPAIAAVTLLVMLTGLATAGPVRSGDAMDRAPVICIDPGHPSEVGRGAHGRHTTEIHIAWVEALKLRTILEKRGYHVVMTKTSENQFVRNRARAETANDAHADYMVRLHCDAGAQSGIASYVPEQTGVSQGVRGPSRQVIEDSVRMGKTFHAALIKSLAGKLLDRGLLPDSASHVGAKQGALTGSIFSHVPVVLVEICVLTNLHDEKFISSKSGQDAVAIALADAVDAALDRVSSTDRPAGHTPR